MVNVKVPPFGRVYAWFYLIQTWGSLRFDHRGVEPALLKRTPEGQRRTVRVEEQNANHFASTEAASRRCSWPAREHTALNRILEISRSSRRGNVPCMQSEPRYISPVVLSPLNLQLLWLWISHLVQKQPSTGVPLSFLVPPASEFAELGRTHGHRVFRLPTTA